MSASPPLAWYFCSDKNHRVLGDRLAGDLAAAGSPFWPRHIKVEDMRAVPSRAAGGVPVMDFKLHCLLHTCLGADEGDAARKGKDDGEDGDTGGDEAVSGGSSADFDASFEGVVAEGEYFVWSDVDVQATAPLSELHSALQGLASGKAPPPTHAAVPVAAAGVDVPVDVWTQREFQLCGANVGFMLLRKTPATRALLAAVRREMANTGGLDQNVLNKMILSGDTHGAVVRRFPAAVWASSNAAAAPALRQMLVHHANFIVRPTGAHHTYSASDPTPKLRQLNAVRELLQLRRSGDADAAAAEVGWGALTNEIAADAGLAAYKARHFNAKTRAAWEAVERTNVKTTAAVF